MLTEERKMDDTKGILLWIGFIVIVAAIYIFSRRIKKQIDSDGIETTGVISDIRDEGGPDEIDIRYYARYRTKYGEEIEGLILNPSQELEIGQRVRLKYHPKLNLNVKVIY